MLVREGDERNETIDLWLACCLAGIAGALNAAAFYAVGFFSANMTGNISILSDHLALSQWATGLFYAAIFLVFIGGAVSAALMISAGRRRGMRHIYAYGILIEAILLTVLGGADLWLTDHWRATCVVLGLAFLMGFQNAVGTRISGARVRTTHVSGLATDIGIELAAAIDMLRGRETDDDAAPNLGKLRLHVCTVLSFLLGGVAGVVLYRAVGGYMIMLSGAILGAIAMSAIAQSRRMTHAS
jgi:uncharacterized membrane protein YoaK (UPF0700 family)